MLRVLQSAAEASGTQYVLVQDGTVLASTREISEMDRPFSAPPRGLSLLGSRYSLGEIVNDRSISRLGGPGTGAALYSFSRILSVIPVAALVFLSALIAGLAISFISANRMKSAVRAALMPLDDLRREIQNMGNDSEAASGILPITELEEIRGTISRTKRDLANARERLAEERARKLSADSYRRLIHDLHNPVSALRQWIQIWVTPESSVSEREEAAVMVPSIADQILRQVGAARKSLEDQPEVLRELDLRDSLRMCWQRIQGSAPASGGREVSLRMPEQPVIVAHDPDLLQRAITNLLENGLEASRTRVDLALDQVEKKVLVRISDDGPGMKEDELPVYLQGRGRSRKADRGALGLASANHIVRTHGGKIVYSRNEAGGATFEVRLEAR